MYEPPTIMGSIDTDEGKAGLVNETLALRSLIDGLIASGKRSFSINDTCNAYGVKRRGFYDFLSIGSIFNVCRRSSNDCFEWFGFDGTKDILEKVSVAVNQEQFSDISRGFSCATNSSLNNISMNVIRLFFYLHVRFLDLRQVAKLFSLGGAKYKTMLRKLYTVATGLELSGIVSRTNRVAEIRFLYPLPESSLMFSPLNVASLLNSKKEMDEETKYQKRRKQFNDLTEDPRMTTLPVTTTYKYFPSLCFFH